MGGAAGGNWRPETRGRKLEMLVFTGKNLDEWIFRAERYFVLNQLMKEEKLETASLCFEDAALAWYLWEQKRRGVRRWDELKVLMRARFGPSMEEPWRSDSSHSIKKV